VTPRDGRVGCIFDCADPFDMTKRTMAVEMNVDVDGKFHAHQNHSEFDHSGPSIVAERVAGIAHVECYKAWYEQTYRTPFTMSA
jgi:hypothetical protein